MTVFYIDVRTPGQELRRVLSDGPWKSMDVHYIKGQVGKVASRSPMDSCSYRASDLLDNRADPYVNADMVVLATAIEPDPAVRKTGHHADSQHRQQQLPHRGSSEASSCRVPHRRCVPFRCLPGTEGYSGDRSPGRRGSSQRPLAFSPRISSATNACTAKPDQLLCNGCSTCANVCPYGAISYEEKASQRPRNP